MSYIFRLRRRIWIDRKAETGEFDPKMVFSGSSDAARGTRMERIPSLIGRAHPRYGEGELASLSLVRNSG